jgi:hypothetical protein
VPGSRASREGTFEFQRRDGQPGREFGLQTEPVPHVSLDAIQRQAQHAVQGVCTSRNLDTGGPRVRDQGFEGLTGVFGGHDLGELHDEGVHHGIARGIGIEDEAAGLSDRLHAIHEHGDRPVTISPGECLAGRAQGRFDPR